jgi:cytochrome c553
MRRGIQGCKGRVVWRNLLCGGVLCGSVLAPTAGTAALPAEGGLAPRSAVAIAKADLRAVLEAKPDVQHGASLFRTCTECHGPQGDGDASGWPPEIAGQHPRVIAKELTDFRAGVRWYDPMKRIAGRHVLGTTQDIADAAAYVSSLPMSAATAMGDGKWLAAGGRLYARRCEWCHGAQGEGSDERFVPRVASQQFEYLLRQLHDAVEGRRPNMRTQHLRLLQGDSSEDLVGLADYMSRLGRPQVEPLPTPRGDVMPPESSLSGK